MFGKLLGGKARGTVALDFDLAFLFHLAAYTAQPAATSSSALVTVGGAWCGVAKLAEFASCTWMHYILVFRDMPWHHLRNLPRLLQRNST